MPESIASQGPELIEAIEAAIAVADWVINFKGSSPSDCDLARMISQPLRQAIARASKSESPNV